MKLGFNWMRAVALIAVMLNALSCGHDSPDRLLSISEAVHAASEKPESGVEVRVRGVVTYAELQAGDCVIQDSSGGVRVLLRRNQGSIKVGQQVEARGLLRTDSGSVLLVEPIIYVLGASVLPAPQTVTLGDGGLARLVNRRIDFRATVESIAPENPEILLITVRSSGSRALVRARHLPQVNLENAVDAEFEITGTLIKPGDASDAKQAARVWSPDDLSLKVTKAAAQVRSLPLTFVRRILSSSQKTVPDHRLRLAGVFLSRSGVPLIRDSTGEMNIHFNPDADKPETHSRADLYGFVRLENGQWILDQATPVAPAHVPLREVNTAFDLHRLPLSVASRRLSVHLQPVVTFFDPKLGVLFVQDGTDAVFVQLRSPFSTPFRTGDLLDLRGVTLMGDFSPNVGDATASVIGSSPLPHPETDLESIFEGRMDCRWVQLSGIIQDVFTEHTGALARVAWGGRTFKAHLAMPYEDARRLIDRRVLMQGAIGPLFNNRRQILGVQIFVPGRQFVRAIDEAAPALSQLVPRHIDELLRFSPNDRLGHRVRVEGVVTLANRSGPTWISDSTGGMKVQSHQPVELKPGDVVDVFGFPEAGGFGVVMKGAMVKKIRSGIPAAPTTISPEDALNGSAESQLVQIDGTVLNSFMERSESVLVLDSGAALFDVRLPLEKMQRPGGPKSLANGTKVRVTGVCALTVDRSRDFIIPRGFEIHMRSPADVMILKGAPWLTTNHLWRLLCGMLVVVVLGLGWIAMLRRNVRLQTRKLEQSNLLANQALQRARQAESLEQDRKNILEMVARDEPLENIMAATARTVVLNMPRALCSIQLDGPDGCRVSVSDQVPATIAGSLANTPLALLSEDSSCLPVAELSRDPSWEAVLAECKDASINSCLAIPILRNSQRVGVIVTFWIGDSVPSEEERSILESWSRFAGLSVERRGHYQQLSYRAHHDNLTGLFNRACLYEHLEKELSGCGKEDRITGVLYIDLDGFKPINDHFGHDAGDAVLQEVSKRILQHIRHTDVAARVGGDEFVVVLGGLRNRSEAERIGALLVDAIRQPIVVNGKEVHAGASLGIGIYPHDGQDAEALLKAADEAMYGIKIRAKSQGNHHRELGDVMRTR